MYVVCITYCKQTSPSTGWTNNIIMMIQITSGCIHPLYSTNVVLGHEKGNKQGASYTWGNTLDRISRLTKKTAN